MEFLKTRDTPNGKPPGTFEAPLITVVAVGGKERMVSTKNRNRTGLVGFEPTNTGIKFPGLTI